MKETSDIEFVLHGKLDGVEITPHTIGLSQFNEYNRQVEDFLRGSEKLKLDQVHVKIQEGSYVLRTAISAALALTSLETDLKLMERQDVLGELDPKRMEVVQKWQSRAKATPDLSYEVRPSGKMLPKIRISYETDYRVGDVIPWVEVEKYLFGKIVDMGGAQKANVHLKLESGGRPVLVGASQDYLREQEENRLYHKVLLHVSAEQHFRTGDLRNIRLISFVRYEPRYNEEALDRFAAKGAEAWADVPDPVQWVRELRGEKSCLPES